MNTAKENITSLLNALPEDCTLEDVQYHLYVVEKIQNSMARSETEGSISQHDIEKKFRQWTIQ
ncbi:MAG: hypothetical protein Q9N32_00825 [Gammaproteobacteria bacterium]|nr:hypothetical protein [Gammaproteobacteria bacterium]